jgi:hypothetical protein
LPRTPKWWWRLFRQTAPFRPPQPMSDLGFGQGEGMLYDSHRLDHLAAAKGGRDRLASSFDYLRKTLKHSQRLTDEVGDGELAELLEERCEWLAEQMLKVVSELESEMRGRGYDRRP